MQTQQLSPVTGLLPLLPPGSATWPSVRTSLTSLQVVGAAGLLGAAAIHAAVLADHYQAWPLAGWFFAALQVVQTAAAVTLVMAPVPRAQLIAAVVTVGPLALWVLSRTAGIPFGPADHQGREAVGVPDTACALLEVAALAAVVALHRRGRGGDSQRGPGHVDLSPVTAALAVTVMVLVTGMGVLTPDEHGGASGHDHGGQLTSGTDHPH